MDDRVKTSLSRMETYLKSPSKQRETGETFNVYPKNTVRHAPRNIQDAESYLKQKGIHDIIDSLLGELLLRRPYDPYEYLIQLLDRRILTRVHFLLKRVLIPLQGWLISSRSKLL